MEQCINRTLFSQNFSRGRKRKCKKWNIHNILYCEYQILPDALDVESTFYFYVHTIIFYHNGGHVE